jgi:hypothetical protein
LIAAHGGPLVLEVELDGEVRRIETTEPLAVLQREAAAATVGKFAVRRPTLEDVFLGLTGRSLRD